MSGAVTTNATPYDSAITQGPDAKHGLSPEAYITAIPASSYSTSVSEAEFSADDLPTNDELRTLVRVGQKINWAVYTIAFVELAERFSFYGTTVVYTNFIARPLQTPTGAAPYHANANATQIVAGALNMDSQAATGITTFNQFWCYIIPLFGAWIADTYLGRYNTIVISVMVAIVGHIILVASATPAMIANESHSLAAFLIGMIIMGLGTGGFKPNISPLVAEQMDIDRMRVTTDKRGRRVILDPAITTNRIYNYFYLFINIGALIGQIAMSYSAFYVGFWLAYLLPTVAFLLCPLVLYFCRNKYRRLPPQGSVLGPAFKLFIKAQKGRWSINPVRTWKNMHDGTFWEKVKPSRYDAASRPSWMVFDDAWVDEVARGFGACSVFLWYPLYWVTYNQLNNNLTNQAATMKLNGIPNDILNNLDPLALIILIPICDLFIYPALRKLGINFSPIKRITLGFYTGAAAMLWSAVIQFYIYSSDVCGDYPSERLPTDPTGNTTCPGVDTSVWAQTGAYILIAISEIFASITSLEYAFSKAPKNMRSLVMAFALFQSALAAAIGEALNPLSGDPLLVWNYGSMGVLSAIGGTLFWFQFRQQDMDEDKLNNLTAGHVGTTAQIIKLDRRRSTALGVEGNEKVVV